MSSYAPLLATLIALTLVVATPVLAGHTIILSNGGPAVGVTVAKRDGQWKADTAWENADVPFRLSNAVLAGDMLFGFSTRNSGQYFGLDPASGKTLWTSEGRQAGKPPCGR